MRVGKSLLFLVVAIFTISTLLATTQSSEARVKFSRSTSCLPKVLKLRLKQIREKFGPIKIISTFRRGALMPGKRKLSRHAQCRAVDFMVRDKWAVYRWLKRNHIGGIGVYSGRCNHIHIDNGYNMRWIKKSC